MDRLGVRFSDKGSYVNIKKTLKKFELVQHNCAKCFVLAVYAIFTVEYSVLLIES